MCIHSILYLPIGVEKSGRNAEGESWWETWQENLHQDEWRFLSVFLSLKQNKRGKKNQQIDF